MIFFPEKFLNGYVTFLTIFLMTINFYDLFPEKFLNRHVIFLKNGLIRFKHDFANNF